MYERELAIEKAERDLKEANNKIQLVTNHINNVDSELFMLQVIERTLIENLETLKSAGIVASTTEYKRSKEELKRTRTMMVTLVNDLKTYKNILKNAEKHMENCRLAMRKAMIYSISTVIYADFGRKKNGQK